MSVLKREYGKEQPYIGCGMFKIRLPFIHFRFTGPEAITGLCNSVTSLAAIATLVGILGIENRQAWAVIVLSCLAYCGIIHLPHYHLCRLHGGFLLHVQHLF